MFAAALSVFAACGEKGFDEQEESKDPAGTITENLEFALEVIKIESDMARVRVVSNGSSFDSWYGFITSDVEASDESLINAEVSKGNLELNRQRVADITVRNLTPETDYKYVVFGLTQDGKVYGTAASVEFATVKAETVYTLNTSWNVEYTGEGVINNTPYEHTITVTSTDANKYFITGYSKEEYEQYSIKEICEAEVAYLKQIIEQYNTANNANLTMDMLLFQGNGVDALKLSGGDWYALAIGVGPDGEPSGLYAVSDLITIEEVEPTEGYASWLGTWTFTGSNDVAFDVTFSKNEVNESYIMTGWEGLTDIPVLVNWYEDYGMWQIDAQYIFDADFGSSGSGKVYFVGNDGTYLYTIDDGAYPICMGGEIEGGRACVGYSEEDPETGDVFAFQFMHYSADISGKFYRISETSVFPTFPIMITEAAETSSVKSMGVERFMRLPIRQIIPDSNIYHMDNIK